MPMKLKQLEIALQEVDGFSKPKVKLEQYSTTPHLAACMLHTAEYQFGDISGQFVADLGCGCGILSIGSSLLHSTFCVGMDIDSDALTIFQQNCKEFELDTVVDILHVDISNIESMFLKKFDTVVMNPPFGTKYNKGVDMDFLYVASKLAKNAVYSLHKSSTREHVIKKAKDFGIKANVVAELKYDLLASYSFHKKSTKDIAVDFIRFTFI